MCPWCGAWLMKAEASNSQKQAERGMLMAQCSKCGRQMAYPENATKTAPPKEPRQRIFRFED